MCRPSTPARLCDWCTKPLPRGSRRDRKTCTKACRQARHRFRVGEASPVDGARPYRFAYADPPYPGLAERYYAQAEVSLPAIVSLLEERQYDGWALSTSSAALQDVLASCPPGVRVGVWVRPTRQVRSKAPLRAWEPVVFAGGRPFAPVVQHLADVLIWRGRQHSHPGALVGMKPAAFCEWIFRMLGARLGDVLDDIYPGSGAVGRAWRMFQCLGTPAPHDVPSRLQEAQAALRGARDDTKKTVNPKG
ncbi:hypothetical protein ES703_60930 [subsurface metagenome]